MREGLPFVFRTPWLWLTISLFAVINVTLVGPYSVAMPFLVQENLHQGIRVLGLLYSFFPIGYLLGGLWLGEKSGLSPLVLLCIAAVINGAAIEVTSLAWTNALQEFVPAEKLGRVVSVDSFGSFALLPMGLALAGWATDLIGAPGVFLIGGGTTAIVSLLLLWLYSIPKVLN